MESQSYRSNVKGRSKGTLRSWSLCFSQASIRKPAASEAQLMSVQSSTANEAGNEHFCKDMNAFFLVRPCLFVTHFHCLPLCFSLCLCVCVCVSLSISLFVSLGLSLPLSPSPHTCTSTYRERDEREREIVLYVLAYWFTCPYLYVCMYICVYIYTYIQIHIYKYTHLCVHILFTTLISLQ